MVNQAPAPTLIGSPGALDVARQQTKERKPSDDSKTNAATRQKLPQEQVASKPIQGHVSDLTAGVGREVVRRTESKSDESFSLVSKVFDLSAATQKLFETQLRNRQSSVADSQSLFSSDNKNYQLEASTLPISEERRAYFHDLKETQQKPYQEACATYEAVKKIFSDRIAFLQTTIKNHKLETLLLNEAMIGNNHSRWATLGYRYGASFRLSEIEQTLESRKYVLGLKADDKLTAEEAELVAATPSEVRVALVNLSRKCVQLKEEVLVFNEAFKKGSFEEFANSDFPKSSCVYHKQCLNVLELEFKKLEENKKTLVTELEGKIKEASGAPDSPQYLAYQQEREEVISRWKIIEQRKKDISDLLVHRKTYFKLSEAELENAKGVKFEDFTQVFSLLERIASFKEDVVRNTWEHFASIEQRRVTYLQESAQAQNLEKEKTTFVNEVLPQRLKVLETAIGTYKGYIRTMQVNLDAIEHHFQILAQDSLEREKWQVNPPEPSVASAETDKKEYKSFFKGYFGGTPAAEPASIPASDAKKEEVKAGAEKKEEVKADALRQDKSSKGFFATFFAGTPAASTASPASEKK